MFLKLSPTKIKKRRKWYLDSECSRQMSIDSSKFMTYTLVDGGSVIFGGTHRGEKISSPPEDGKNSPHAKGTIDIL